MLSKYYLTAKFRPTRWEPLVRVVMIALKTLRIENDRLWSWLFNKAWKNTDDFSHN